MAGVVPTNPIRFVDNLATGARTCHHAAVRKYVIMGVQGSGKGTQAKLLADTFDLVHMSVGDIFNCAPLITQGCP